MIALLLQAADPQYPSPALPADWSAMMPLPYAAPRPVTPQVASFVSGEIAGGRCSVPGPADGHYVVRVDVAALVGNDGVVRRVVPHAIGCPTVEQYAAGLVSGFARGNLLLRRSMVESWYRATVVFDWHG